MCRTRSKAACRGTGTGMGSSSVTTAKATCISRRTRCAQCCTRTACARASCARTGAAARRAVWSRSSSVRPEDRCYGQDILIPKGATGVAKPGQVVVVELTEPPALFGQPVGRITEVLGEVDDPGMEIEIAVRKYGVPHEFSAAGLAQAKGLPDKVRAQDKKHRVNL